jgi:hypothetical protein
MNPHPVERTLGLGEAESRKEIKPPKRLRPKTTRPPLPEDYKNLCALCRSGKLFAIQEWFKNHNYDEPERYLKDRRAAIGGWFQNCRNGLKPMNVNNFWNNKSAPPLEGTGRKRFRPRPLYAQNNIKMWCH